MPADAPPDPPPPDDFAREFTSTLGELRQALAVGVRRAGPPSERAQDLARHFELDKNLAWKLAHLIELDGLVEALRFVPGQSGLQILAERLGAKVEAPVRERIVAAAERFERLQQRHAGDRASLELLALGLAEDAPAPGLVEPVRRQAYLGNSAVWGFQARTQVALFGVRPDPDEPDGVRLLQFGGLLGLRRLRPKVRIEVLSLERVDAPRPPRLLGDGPGSPLLGRFGLPGAPPLECSGPTGAERYELGPGPVGETARTDCVWGLAHDGYAPRRRTAERSEVELCTTLLAPSEALEFVALVDRRLEWGLDSTPRLHGRLTSGGPDADPVRLPLESRPRQSLEPHAELAGQHGPRLGELLDVLLAQLGSELDAHDVWRLPVAYPPIPSELRLRFLLPAR